jgi:hypothetical protein
VADAVLGGNPSAPDFVPAPDPGRSNLHKSTGGQEQEQQEEEEAARLERGRSSLGGKPILRPKRPPPSAAGTISNELNLYAVVCTHANVRPDREGKGKSLGVLVLGTVLAARREDHNGGGRGRVQFEIDSSPRNRGGPDGGGGRAQPKKQPKKFGWVSVVSKAGRVLLRRCNQWHSAAPMRRAIASRLERGVVLSRGGCSDGHLEAQPEPQQGEAQAEAEAGAGAGAVLVVTSSLHSDVATMPRPPRLASFWCAKRCAVRAGWMPPPPSSNGGGE